ncbi:epsin-3 [Brienomyrus brachyistius]|uniref:epsin-3 n=1 Tax=Brienomyrus brachyistius TaxID=42636 RepID=UPI0020B460EF|nr:epsin-3 [Brienomyrus brachyistius]
MTTSALRRQVKNIVHNYSEAEIKVREATSNDPWGPPSSLMSEISDMTFNVVAFTEVMGMIWKRLNDHGKNWRHVYKALTLLDYLMKTGSERVAQQCRENAFTIQTLRDFQYVDRDGKDQGVNVREKAKQLVALMRDEERLRTERAQALKTKERMAGATSGMGSGSGSGSGPGLGPGPGSSTLPSYPSRRTSQPSMAALYGEEFSRSRGSPSSFNSSSSSPRVPSDLEQSRPQTSGEEELQLQLALAMSREESEKPGPASSVALEMDEEALLQIALTLSKEEHDQEQRTRQGDESLLQKALEASRRESESGTRESAMVDLVDIFGPDPAAPLDSEPWESQAVILPTSDPWDSVTVVRSDTPVFGSPWTAPPLSSSPSQAWVPRYSPPDPWEAQPTAPSPNPISHAWSSPAHTGASGLDPFSVPMEVPKEPEAPPQLFLPRPGSPGGVERVSRDQMNGRGGGSPELFDLSRLGDTLGEPSPRSCRTPEAFLGPTAASLVNLDTLIPYNPPAKNKNPFLSGLSAPSPTNPFHSDQPRLTLNQMRPSSTSPLPGSALPYSASLPLPLSRQSPALTSSFTQPPTLAAVGPPGLLEVPGNLPQPLLPLSPAAAPGDHLSGNPFL